MIDHEVRTYPSWARLARKDQLAWKLAAVATDPVEVTDEVTEMVINRVIDDAAVAAASVARGPVRAAREQGLRHPATPGAAVWGAAREVRISPEWAAPCPLLRAGAGDAAGDRRAVAEDQHS
jgi:2-methylcitrate dehydratase